MAGEAHSSAPQSPAARQGQARVWARRLGWALALVLAPLLLLGAFLSTPIGKRVIADQIAAAAPASGLRFTVGRIEGDVFGKAVLRRVTVRDPKGVFLTIPEVQLDWRPLAWLWSGLDVRELTARRARLTRLPELLPGDPDAPLLPDFDIRLDRLTIEDMVIARGLATQREERANLSAKVDIRQGRALIDASARLGAADRVRLLIDAEPDGDRFDIEGDYRAPAGGVLAGLAGLSNGYEARIVGDGTWQRWRGAALARRMAPAGGAVRAGTRGERVLAEQAREQRMRAVRAGTRGERVAAFTISNDAGVYGVLGQINAPLGPETLAGRALGKATALAASFTLAKSVIEGRAALVSRGLDGRAAGVVDLADKRVRGARVQLALRDPALLGPDLLLDRARLAANLAGPFADLAIKHEIALARLETAGFRAAGLSQEGSARLTQGVLSLPLVMRVEQVTTGLALADPRLVKGRLGGRLTYDLARQRLAIDGARLTFPGLDARFALRGDVGAGAYALAGPVSARGLRFDGLGEVNATANILASFGSAAPWRLAAKLDGSLSRITNATLVELAGERIRLAGALQLGAGAPIVLDNAVISAPRLNARITSRVVSAGGGARTVLTGSGRQARYGPFSLDAEIAADGPRGVLVLADPYPAARLKDVRIALAPRAEGFGLDVAGQSLLGPFDGALALVLEADAPTWIVIDRLDVERTRLAGAVVLGPGGPSGDLSLSGGGITGTARLRPEGAGATGFVLDLAARNAAFGGAVPISLARAELKASGRLGEGTSRIAAELSGSGLAYGAVRLANVSAKAQIEDGRGAVRGTISGRRTDRFALNFDAALAPGRIAAALRGDYAGMAITMPRRAVLTAAEGGGWQLAPSQIGFGGGFALIEGALGGEETRLTLKLAQMPLRLFDLAGADLGLGGRLSGVIDYRQALRAPPEGRARIQIERFSRAGLVLSSRPVNVLGVIELGADRLTAAGRLLEGEARLGDVALRIAGLGREGALGERLMRGRLDARLAYEGAAEALWRLAAIEAFDLSGPVSLAARATGTLADPRIIGTARSSNLVLASALTGTRIEKIALAGRFSGSRLELVRFAGTTAGGGAISGSGTIDLARMGQGRGPQLDLRAAAKGARLLNANGLDATLTGPLRIVSDGLGGTIAGRVRVERARWALGVAGEDMALPVIATREINRADGLAPARSQASARGAAWRYLVNASGPGRIEVDGMGLESEWGIDIALRGTVDDPRIGGTARLVRGDYTFAGTRFELTRGRILFDTGEPINPRLDIAAEATRSGTNVAIAITGNALSPAIAFSSEPALPEEEILARLLFGGSVTSLSATDAVQLAAALAALQSGGAGLDPIGQLRRSIGLDQLRIVNADPLTGRQTGIAIGKNITRNIYVELVTDGRGYSATEVEYRITSWLSLLGTVSTIGRDSVLVQASRDY